jgi:hypothetical protein
MAMAAMHHRIDAVDGSILLSSVGNVYRVSPAGVFDRLHQVGRGASGGTEIVTDEAGSYYFGTQSGATSIVAHRPDGRKETLASTTAPNFRRMIAGQARAAESWEQ